MFKRLKQWLLSKLDRQLGDNEIALSRPGEQIEPVRSGLRVVDGEKREEPRKEAVS